MTPRQKQALDYRRSGLLLKEIGHRMGISKERARQLVLQARWHELGSPGARDHKAHRRGREIR